MSDTQQQMDFALAVAKVLEAAYPQGDMPPKLWHYTSNAKLLDILESKSLWATHASCVNDTSEAQHLFNFIFRFLNRWNAGPGAKPIIDHIKGLGKDYCVTCDWFITSLCTDGNDLNLWRAYTGPDGGVSIGFNSEKLLSQAWKSEASIKAQGLPETYLLPVLYDPAKKIKLVSNLVREIIKLFITHSKHGAYLSPKNYCTNLEDQIAVIAPLIKHEAFKSENEWRLIAKFGNRKLSSLQFSARRTTITRHLPLNLALNGKSDQPVLPIVDIKIGPSQHQNITKASVEALLQSKGYSGVNVTCSPIPFRPL